ncbi:polysaccharide pyruvyl transferase family protein [Desulfobacterota bacterium M19]
MNLALLTYHRVPNFGANLQALVTIRQLAARGHDVTILDYIPLGLESVYAKRVPEDQRAAHEQFVIKNMRISERLRNMDDCKSWLIDNDVDAFIVGSDAVMQLRRDSKTADLQFPNPFWLPAWAKEVKTAMISGSSMGCSYLRLKQPLNLVRIARCLLAYDYISVRDRWTQNLVRNSTLGLRKPPVTPDPVFSLNQVLKRKEVQQLPNEGIDKPYILLSCMKGRLSDKWVKKFVEISHAHGCDVYELPMPEGYADLPVDKQVQFPLPPIQWYLWLKHAQGFVGQRFHSVIACLHNAVPFVTIDSYGNLVKDDRKSKIYDLCERNSVLKQRILYQMVNDLPPTQAWSILKSFDIQNAKKNAEEMAHATGDNLDQLLAAISR